MTSGIGNNWPYNEPYNYPSYGPSSTTSSYTTSTPHLNFFQHWFGTSTTSVIINLFVLAVILYLIGRFVVLPIARRILDALDFRYLINEPAVFMELTPPSNVNKTPKATSQFLAMLHSLNRINSRNERLRRRKTVLALEIAASRENGIRYIVRMPKTVLTNFKQAVKAYLPEVRFAEAKDYLPATTGQLDNGQLMQFEQFRHFALPLPTDTTPDDHDPMAYLTSTMTQLAPEDLMVFQLVVAPASSQAIHKAHNNLMHGEAIDLNQGFWHFVGSVVAVTFAMIRAIPKALLIMLLNYKPRHKQPAPSTVHQQNIDASMLGKLSQPIMQVDIRAYVRSADNQVTRAHGLKAAVSAIQNEGFQRLVLKHSWPFELAKRFERFKFTHRLPSALTDNSSLLSVLEVAALFHFPYTASAEDTVHSLSRSLPAPLAMKRLADKDGFDVVLGENNYHDAKTAIGLSAAERERHVYILGGTGNGKSTMLEYAIVQDLKAGKGLAVIDPHGDLAQDLLRHIPKGRIKDVVYLNPIDITRPIGINLLELPTDLSDDDLLLEKGRVTEAAVSVLRKVFSDDEANAHRIEAMLRNTIRTAFTVKDATLFTVLKLLRNKDYRNAVVDKLDDEDLRDFWKGEFSAAGEWQRVSMSKGLTARIDRFNSDEPTRRILEQPKSTINFEDIIDSGKILICNFAEGELGEDTSALFGTTILAKLKLAAERRARMAQSDRRPFYLYVDEFQNFATTPFVKMLSASRKYKLFLTIAQQSTAQQDEQRLTEAILANVSTVICFRTGSPLDEDLLLPRFRPAIKEGDIGNLPAFNFYMKLTAITPQAPLSGETLLLKDEGSAEITEKVIESSRKRHASVYVKPEKPAASTANVQKTVSASHDKQQTVAMKKALKTSG